MPTPLRQALTLLTLASLTLLPPLTMAQTTAPLPPAEPMAQEVGALWDPATITPLKLLNIDLFSRSELGQPVVVQPVIPYPSVGGGLVCLLPRDLGRPAIEIGRRDRLPPTALRSFAAWK